jgi:tetratricopeptide (TPR) repeat protein
MAGMQSPEYNDLYDYADYCVRDGRHEEALALYEKLLEISPGNDSLLFSIAWVYRDMGDTDKALEWLERLLERELARNVFTGFAYDELVKTYREMGEYGKLVQLCERAAEVYPDETALLATLGDACLRSGRHERAFQVFSTLVEMEADMPLYHLNRGVAAVGLGRYQTAEQSCAEAVRLEPGDGPMVYDRLAAAYEEAECWDRAETSRRRSIDVDRDNPLYRCSLGDLYLRQGKIEDARNVYDEACGIDPSSRGAFRNRLANMMIREGLVREAIDEFEKAVSADPHNPFYYLSLIVCCEQVGDKDRAARFRDRGRLEGVLPG